MPTCKEIIELLSEYVDEGLSEERRRDLDLHMGTCPACVRFLESLQATRDRVRSLRCEEIPPEVQTMLRTFLDRETKGRPT